MIEDLYNEQEDLDAQVIDDINPAEEDPNATYQFATGDIAPSEQLDAFMEEFAVAKEEKDAPDEPTPEELETLETGDIEDEEEISSQTARNTAQFLVSTIDEGASIGLAWKAGVAAEIIAMPKNTIGTMIGEAKLYIESATMFAWTLTVILLSLVIEFLFTRLLGYLVKTQEAKEAS